MDPRQTLQRGDLIQLEIQSAAFEGKSVARLDGLVVFVEGGVPGDVVRAKVLKVKKNHAEARVAELLRPSPLRTTPRCVHFGVCGGCKWQHVAYEAQLKFKQQHVIDAFERIGGFADLPVHTIIGADEQYLYRNKMEYSFSDQEWVETLPPEGPQGEEHHLFLGLHVPQRYDKVLDLRECHLQSEESQSILLYTREFARKSGHPVYSSDLDSGYFRFLVIRQSKRVKELMVNLVTFEDRPDVVRSYTAGLLKQVPGVTTVVNTLNTRKAQIALGETENVYHGSGHIRERLGNYLFTISASSFFQTNTAQAERLYAVAADLAQLKGNEVVFDLYSGTGTIAIMVSESAGSVVGIESSPGAIRDAERNLAENKIRNCRFVLGDLKERLTEDRAWMDSLPRPDVVIIDPPRNGMHPKVVDEVGKLGALRIVYISCNPATQARDVKLLSPFGYSIHNLQPVDMFPHTFHVENVALLELAPQRKSDLS